MHESIEGRLAISSIIPPYHLALRDYLKQSQAEVWNWFANQRMSAATAENVRFDLLKSTYRIDRADQAQLYLDATNVAAELSITAPLTLYQAQNPEGLNAALAFLPGEAHLVFHGPLSNQLSAVELRAILAHELAHFALWDRWDGELKLVFDCLQAFANDPHAQPTHFATLRLYQLYAEVFCDRVALAITADLPSVVSALVKVQTGVADINPESFLRQAEEIFARENASTVGLTHPETFIRARALQLWDEQGPDAAARIAGMIEGEPKIDELDLLGRRRLSEFTRQILDSLLRYKWFQTDLALAHARLFFHDYTFPREDDEESVFSADIRNVHTSVRDYYCFVLLDFVAVERDLEELPVAAALSIAEKLEVKPRFIELLRQELKIRKAQIDRVDSEKERLLLEEVQK